MSARSHAAPLARPCKSHLVIQLIRNCDIYAPKHVGLRDLLVANGRVEVVTTAESLDSLPAAVRVVEIDLVGRRLIPALIDGHVHITGGGGESGPESRIARPSSSGSKPRTRSASLLSSSPSMPTTAAACRLD